MRGSGAVACVAIILLVLFPLLYVLSIGPAVWMYDRGLLGTRLADVCEKIYWPLEWSRRKVPFVERPLMAYISCFRQAQPPPQPAPLPAATLPTPVSPAIVPATPLDDAPAAAGQPTTEVPDLSEPAICR